MDLVPTYSVKVRGVKQDVNKLHAYHPYFKTKYPKGLHGGSWLTCNISAVRHSLFVQPEFINGN